MTDRYSGQPRASAFVEMASVGNADRTEWYYSTAARWTLMRHVAGQSARVAAGEAENDVEAADAGSNQHPIGANNVQFNYGKDNADHRLRCDSSRRRPCLLDICAACADGLARMRRSVLFWRDTQLQVLHQPRSSLKTNSSIGSAPIPLARTRDGRPLIASSPKMRWRGKNHSSDRMPRPATSRRWQTIVWIGDRRSPGRLQGEKTEMRFYPSVRPSDAMPCKAKRYV
jgi:hypothetical protein